VIDVDYHHGNGTQEIFYDRADVQYVSLHADPTRAYPFTIGFADETGTGAGLGATLNLPLAQAVADDEYVATLDRACARCSGSTRLCSSSRSGWTRSSPTRSATSPSPPTVPPLRRAGRHARTTDGRAPRRRLRRRRPRRERPPLAAGLCAGAGC